MAEQGHGSERGPPNQGQEEESTFKFPIQEPEEDGEIKMKNIPPSMLPNFYGMASEDPDSLFFEFDIVC